MRKWKYLIAAAALALTACEQAQMNGPIAGGNVAVEELRSGSVVVSGLTTSDPDFVIGVVGQEKYDSYRPFQKLLNLGISTFEDDVVFDANTWYLMSVSGGFDYDADRNNAADEIPTQVFGTVHAVVRGARLNDGGFVLSPLTESAYQFVKDYVDLMTDAELAQALEDLAPELVNDVNDDGAVEYLDVLLWSRLFHNNRLAANGSRVRTLADSLSRGDSANSVQSRSRELFSARAPDGIDEAFFAARVSSIVQGICGVCHRPGGSGSRSSNHDLQPTSNSNHVALNTAMYRALVQSRGVNHIINKATGQIGHGGGNQLGRQGRQDELATFEEFLNLL